MYEHQKKILCEKYLCALSSDIPEFMVDFLSPYGPTLGQLDKWETAAHVDSKMMQFLLDLDKEALSEKDFTERSSNHFRFVVDSSSSHRTIINHLDEWEVAARVKSDLRNAVPAGLARGGRELRPCGAHVRRNQLLCADPVDQSVTIILHKYSKSDCDDNDAPLLCAGPDSDITFLI